MSISTERLKYELEKVKDELKTISYIDKNFMYYTVQELLLINLINLSNANDKIKNMDK